LPIADSVFTDQREAFTRAGTGNLFTHGLFKVEAAGSNKPLLGSIPIPN
jgi:hypothetical protein